MRGHDHPIFTLAYRLIAGAGEHTGVAEARTDLLARAGGRLLIIGLGPGYDLDHVSDSVESVVAIEPSHSMRVSAESRIRATRERGIAVDVIDALGEDLPLPDDSIDAVLLAFVMCSVDDVAGVLSEVRRVARPGATVCVLEHVQAPDGTWMRWMQRAMAPFWPRVTGGCHADRRTRGALEQAGFDTGELVDTTFVNIPPVAPTLVGTTTV